MSKIAIIIPARYNSTRLPGKPLVQLAGQSMLARVYANALKACDLCDGVSVAIATDDERIIRHAKQFTDNVFMTPSDLETGSDRILAAANFLPSQPDFVINLQGDAPFTPPAFIVKMIEAYQNNPAIKVVTPYVKLTWSALDALRDNKHTTPFSGTLLTKNKNNQALWFSKQIIPAMRKEAAMREQSDFSPVLRHIGLYGFTYQTLETFVTLAPGFYEQLEGLEQLRLLENDIPIHVCEVDYAGMPAMSGIDSPEDVERARVLLTHG